jgi:hypothetical protein
MAENIKFTGKQNPEEKPAREDLKPIRELISHFHGRKEAEPRHESLQEVLKRIDDDWRFGKLGAAAWVHKARIEKLMKNFKVDEELTRSMRTMIRRVGRDILSKDEIKEAEEGFIAAKHSYKRRDSEGEYFAGRIKVSEAIFELDTAARLNVLKCHEPAHHVHSFIRMKQLDGGDIHDPIVKKLYDSMHGFYNNDSIWNVEALYTGGYREKIANAISLDILGETEARIYTHFKIFRGDVVWLEDLLHENPKKFRELMENPSWWVEAGSVESLVKRLKRE